MSAMTPQALANANHDDDSGLSGEALQAALFSRLRRETRIAVMDCHSLYREMYGMETPLTILGWITTWKRGWGLREDDAVRILRLAIAPEMVREAKNATDLKRMLAGMAAEKIRARQREARVAESRTDQRTPSERQKASELISQVAENFGRTA
jgi:hypothetical protein